MTPIRITASLSPAIRIGLQYNPHPVHQADDRCGLLWYSGDVV